jgi:hypothetical protein
MPPPILVAHSPDFSIYPVLSKVETITRELTRTSVQADDHTDRHASGAIRPSVSPRSPTITSSRSNYCKQRIHILMCLSHTLLASMKIPKKRGAEKSNLSPERSNKRICLGSGERSLIPDSDLEPNTTASSSTDQKLAPATEAGISKVFPSVKRTESITESALRPLYPRYSRDAPLLKRLKQVNLIELYKFAKNERGFCTPIDESDWHDLIDHWILFHPYFAKRELSDPDVQCKTPVYDREEMVQQQERLKGSHYEFKHFVTIGKIYNSIMTGAVELEEAVTAFLDFYHILPWSKWHLI